MKYINKKGFTLVELIVTIIILGVIAGIAVPKTIEITKQSRINTLMTNLQIVNKVVSEYYLKNGKMPNEGETTFAKGQYPGVDYINSKLPQSLSSMGITYYGWNNSTSYFIEVTLPNIKLKSTDASLFIGKPNWWSNSGSQVYFLFDLSKLK